MLAHDVSAEDAEIKAKADRMYRRVCEGLTAEVAEAFGHQASGTEDLEQQLRDAVSFKDRDRAIRISGQPAKQHRHAGWATVQPRRIGQPAPPCPSAGTVLRIFEDS